MTVYEEYFKESKLNNTEVHNTFLDDLEDILSKDCQPTILSDAIYKTPWFKKIESKGWYWVGRVRGNVQISLDNKNFKACTEIMKAAKAKPKGLGSLLYSKQTEFLHCRR